MNFCSCLATLIVRFYSCLAIDPCDSSPCINGECVKIDHINYQCNCHQGFTGANCETGEFFLQRGQILNVTCVVCSMFVFLLKDCIYD